MAKVTFIVIFCKFADFIIYVPANITYKQVYFPPQNVAFLLLVYDRAELKILELQRACTKTTKILTSFYIELYHSIHLFETRKPV